VTANTSAEAAVDDASEAKPEISAELTAEQIANYLTTNPNFFDDQDDLLAGIQVNHSDGDTISLVERQVRVLRERNEQLETRLEGFVTAARQNDEVLQRLHRLTLELAGHATLTELLEALRIKLHGDFAIPQLEFILLDGLTQDDPGLAARAFAPDDQALAAFSAIIAGEGAICGRLGKERHHFLFGDRAAAIRSAAVLALRADDETLGLLALGSDDETRFDPTGGVEILNRLGELIGTFIKHRAE